MIIDKKGKLFGKLNIVDLAIILIVIVALVGVGYKYTQSQTVSPLTKTNDAIITFTESERVDYAVTAIKEGDLVRDRVSGVVLGNVEKIVTAPSVVVVYTSEGEPVSTTRPGYLYYDISVKCNGILTDTGITIGGTEFYVNKQNEVRFGISNLYPRISNIEGIKE